MHSLFFAMKRAHLRTLEIEKALLRPFDMTPARFDLMRVVFVHKNGVTQWRLRALLGVHHSTVSKMVKSLVALGFVRREASENDKRDRIVSITSLGRTAVDDALRALVDTLLAERMAVRGGDFDPERGKANVELLERLLATMRGAYGDEARFNHPWSRAELDPYCRHFRPGLSIRPDDTRPSREEREEREEQIAYGGSSASAS